MDYQVKLDLFEGPFDLLMTLIKEQEIDLYDIPIAHITRQYLEYLDLMRELNLDIAGEFLVMAATLTQIKSHMLLPPPESIEDGEEEAEDPRAELVRRLQEYRKYKEAASKLRDRESIFNNVYGRDTGPDYDISDGEIHLEVSMFDLLSAFKKVLNNAEKRLGNVIKQDEMTVTDRINQILEMLTTGEPTVFSALFKGAAYRIDIIVTFLALLELIRLRMVRVRQGDQFGSIWVFKIA